MLILPTNISLRQPYSVLVVIYNKNKDFLLIQRADDANFWQSVTGGIDEGETAITTAYRELLEETGIDARALGLVIREHHKTNQYTIREQWRYRYQADALINTEYVFSICVPDNIAIKLNPNEHTDFIWLPQQQAAEKAWSASNQAEILDL